MRVYFVRWEDNGVSLMTQEELDQWKANLNELGDDFDNKIKIICYEDNVNYIGE